MADAGCKSLVPAAGLHDRVGMLGSATSAGSSYCGAARTTIGRSSTTSRKRTAESADAAPDTLWPRTTALASTTIHATFGMAAPCQSNAKLPSDAVVVICGAPPASVLHRPRIGSRGPLRRDRVLWVTLALGIRVPTESITTPAIRAVQSLSGGATADLHAAAINAIPATVGISRYCDKESSWFRAPVSDHAASQSRAVSPSISRTAWWRSSPR